MDQISPPVRIVAVVALLFAAAWFTMLKPSDESAPAAVGAAPTATATPVVDSTTRPANTGPGRAVQAAKRAARKQEASDARSSGVSTPPVAATVAKPEAAKPKPTAPAKPGAARAKDTGVPAPVAHAIARHKVLALLFFNPRGADDRVVRRELARVNRHDGKVFVRAVPLRRLSHYARITRGAAVEQSPSVVVIDRKLHAQLLPGYVDRVTIDQAVSDALRAK